MTTLTLIIIVLLSWFTIGFLIAFIGSRFNKNVDGFEIILYWPIHVIVYLLLKIVFKLFDVVKIRHPTIEDLMSD